MAEVTPTPDAKDVAENKVFAILAYFGILFLIPLFAAKESPFARFHTNQGLNLFLTQIAVWIIVLILSLISSILGMIGSILYLGMFILFILGVINAAKGEMKELPLIGKFRLIK
ncbi:MAG: DUF4870 domain-containing protein [Tannerella sp.]|jgi:uncharacterized membrane protein|nr:DUF4870 domain-containing protein [Tannerella sp.]